MKVSEAAELYETDAAGVWELVARGTLSATKNEDGTWNIKVA